MFCNLDAPKSTALCSFRFKNETVLRFCNLDVLKVRRALDCVERGSFRASRLGVRRCFYRLGVGWWVYKIERVLSCGGLRRERFF